MHPVNKFKPRKSAKVASQSGKRSLSAAAPADVPRPGRPTIGDVAALAGVSIKTVSRVFNSEPNVAPATRSLVQTAITALGYSPNHSARSLAARESLTLGLLYDNPSPNYIHQVQRGALQSCQEAGYDLLLHPCEFGNKTISDEIINLHRQGRFDGVILTPPLSDMAAAVDALVAAGGPNDMGTLRDIQVLRDGQVIQRLDVYQFLLNPQFKGEFYLQDNDYLFVGPAENVVSIGGEIMRPMAYELLAKENLLDLLQLAGGTTPRAYTDRIQIERMGDNKISLLDIPSAQFGSTKLKRGDSVRIPAMNAELRRFVSIDGAVMQPGTYSFEEGLTAEALIQLAGGTLPDVVRKEAYISRMKEDQTLTFISFNLDEALHGKGPALQNKDRLSILGVPDFDENMAVSIAGAVREPKTIAFAEGMTLGDVLRLAGGLNPNADYTRVEVNRLTAFSNYQGGTNREVRTVAAVTEVPKELSKSLDIEDPSLEFALQPYDQVVVREIPDFELQNLVLIQGEVRYPGYYALLSKDEKVASLVQRAGGLTPYASAKNASLVREGKPNIAMDLNAALATKTSQFNIVMVEGDNLEIPRTESLISITGPGTKYFVRNGEQTVNAPFVPGRRANYYVKQFGLGYAKKADKSDTYLTYENGQFRKSLDFGVFRIQPVVRRGATIHTVLAEPKANKEKKEVKPLDWNQAIATVTSAILGFSTVYVLLTR